MSGPRYSIIPCQAVYDERFKLSHYRILGCLGHHTDELGWCRLKQKTMAEKLGYTRELINRTIKQLSTWGYVENRDNRAEANGFHACSSYRVLMDRPGAPSDALDHEGGLSDHHPSDAADHHPGDICDHIINDPSLKRPKIETPLPPMRGEAAQSETVVSSVTETVTPTGTVPPPVELKLEPTPETSKKTRQRKALTELPEDWTPSEVMLAAACKSYGLERRAVTFVADQFRNYWHGKGTMQKDWAAVWRKWIGKAAGEGIKVPKAWEAEPANDPDNLDHKISVAKFTVKTGHIGTAAADFGWRMVKHAEDFLASLAPSNLQAA